MDQVQIEAKQKDLENSVRIVSNALTLVLEAPITGAHSEAVAEVLKWFTGFKSALLNQQDLLKQLKIDTTVNDPEIVTP